ncbi:MAG: hypothetical protein ACOCUT_03640, partial [bacterium]
MRKKLISGNVQKVMLLILTMVLIDCSVLHSQIHSSKKHNYKKDDLLYDYSEISKRAIFNFNELSSLFSDSTTYINLDTINITRNPALYSCVQDTIDTAYLYVLLKMGLETYEFGYKNFHA